MSLNFQVDLNAHHVGQNLFNNGGSLLELRENMLKQKNDGAAQSMVVGFMDAFLVCVREIRLGQTGK